MKQARSDDVRVGGDGFFAWVPRAARHYLLHTERGVGVRALARAAACHPSTVLRQVRRFETLRDDPLIDDGLRCLGRALHRGSASPHAKEHDEMTFQDRPESAETNEWGMPDDATLAREARRVLRRLAEPGAVLAVASEMDKAVVVRESAAGQSTRTAVVERAVAQALSLKEWIECVQPGRIARYRITAGGRAAVGRMLAEAENAAQGFAEAPAGFATAGPGQGAGRDAPRPGRSRFSFADSPLAALARRKDRDGTPFLSEALVAAGERLREDFELAQMGPRHGQNWERFLTGPVDESASGWDSQGGSQAARERVARALRELGPGLGDVALRCCCYLEGLETAEKRMGWSARSGKIVLRIALQRLKLHYDGLGEQGGLIG